MNRGIGRTSTLVLGLFAMAALFGVEEGAGQILAVGGQASANTDFSDDLTWGVGGRGQVSFPLTGLGIQGTVDFFSPDCGPIGCDFREISLNLIWSLPVPFLVSPYLGAGIATQSYDGAGEDTIYGVNFLGGLILDGPTFSRIRPFAEIKYQTMEDLDAQKIFSGGILLVIL